MIVLQLLRKYMKNTNIVGCMCNTVEKDGEREKERVSVRQRKMERERPTHSAWVTVS